MASIDEDLRSRLRAAPFSHAPARRRPDLQARPQPTLFADITPQVKAPHPQPAAHHAPAQIAAPSSQVRITPAVPKQPRSANPAVLRPSRSQVLRRDIVQKLVAAAPKRRMRQLTPWALAGMAMLVFGLGLVVALGGWRTNHQVQAQVQRLVQSTASTTTKPQSAPVVVPGTVAPAPAAVTSYTVAPNLPRYLTIPSLGVHARILSVGITAQGALQTPSNVYDTAWYNESAQPGQPGAMLIDGHVSSWTTHGVFYGLKGLKPGDRVQVERGDGTTFTYKVVKSQVYDAGNVDMAAALTPVTPGVPGLNLITCDGQVKAGTSEFNQRIVVFTEQVS